MENYFEYVLSSLTIDDVFILGALQEAEATAGFKAVSNADLQKTVAFTEATYRRTINRLCANKFVETINVKKQNLLYLTEYGIAAVTKSLERVGA
ncbi:hypothetical protein GRF59_14635 [Paenibacillus sp. HJL G12]|uniref:MarR family transcriptional regulator n=1 Tax=Paenibacillus dendrobii TaxID=2691084 RepID=A0A7X3LI40_9BACL|nr:hypothetical protein [Paenibacillus dendrobii]MWV44855.1 hypothetical protein [Paenibacillus dendrobii]